MMTLQTRIMLLVTTLLVLAVLGAAGAVTWTTRHSMLDQSESDGQIIAELLARSAGFAEQVPQDVEDAIGDQMVVSATITSYLVAVAEDDGRTPEEITTMLREITGRTDLDEFWITDEQGHAYLHTAPGIDFTFSPDAREQPQASVFWPLLTGEETSVVQQAQTREIDDGVFKYVGVGGVDHPRIVQLGTSAELLEQLAVELGPVGLVDEIVAGGDVVSIRIVDHNFQTIAFSVPPGSDEPATDWTQVDSSLRGPITSGETTSERGDGVLQVAAPILNGDGHVTGAVLVSLSTARADEAVEEVLIVAAIVVVLVVLAGALASIAMARWVTRPVAALTEAAAAIESDTYELDGVQVVAKRSDGLGQLARVFQRMAEEVRAREQRLQEQVQELRIEIDRSQEAKQVAAITETDYFQQLQARARAMRTKPAHPAPGPASGD